MLEWIGYLCIETLGIPYGFDSPIAIVFVFSGESRNFAITYSATGSSFTLRDYSGVRVDAGLPLFWFM